MRLVYIAGFVDGYSLLSTKRECLGRFNGATYESIVIGIMARDPAIEPNLAIIVAMEQLCAAR
jgi:hypothetical protein